ncbi:hypothetical protein [Actinomadura sp. 3N407]|uniref:hypothetical protein n=1 Tax=Actinomadura sp. 3N407 TaxID=3457423 RepID=UPI003FCD6433
MLRNFSDARSSPDVSAVPPRAQTIQGTRRTASLTAARSGSSHGPSRSPVLETNHRPSLPLEMVRNRPQLVPELLRSVFGVDVPDLVPTTLTSESYADVNPAELRCDATVLLGDPKRPKLGVVVESQLRPRDQKCNVAVV